MAKAIWVVLVFVVVVLAAFAFLVVDFSGNGTDTVPVVSDTAVYDTDPATEQPPPPNGTTDGGGAGSSAPVTLGSLSILSYVLFTDGTRLTFSGSQALTVYVATKPVDSFYFKADFTPAYDMSVDGARSTFKVTIHRTQAAYPYYAATPLLTFDLGIGTYLTPAHSTSTIAQHIEPAAYFGSLADGTYRVMYTMKLALKLPAESLPRTFDVVYSPPAVIVTEGGGGGGGGGTGTPKYLSVVSASKIVYVAEVKR